MDILYFSRVALLNKTVIFRSKKVRLSAITSCDTNAIMCKERHYMNMEIISLYCFLNVYVDATMMTTALYYIIEVEIENNM